MDRLQQINVERIRWCCTERGITTDQLAHDVNISTSTMAAAMSSDEGLTFNQLSKIAKYFDRGVLFFLEQGPVDEVRVYSPQFRTLTNQKPQLPPKVRQLIQRVERQRDIYISLQEQLDDGSWSSFNPPEIPGRGLKRAAESVRKWLHLTTERTFDEYRSAIEARGILVFRTNGYAGKWQIDKRTPVLGFCLYDASHPVIVVKKQDAESRQTFTLFHELAHLLLHRTSLVDEQVDFDSERRNERDANEFAGRVLVPDDLLRAIDDSERPYEVSEYDSWLSKAKTISGASTDAILIRLIGAGRLPQASYQQYRDWWNERAARIPASTGNREYRHREPKHIFGDSFVRTVFDALHARQITLTRASRYLDSLKLSDLRRLEEHYAGL